MATGGIIWPPRNEHLAKNSTCTTPGHEADLGTGQRVGPKNKISHHGDLKELDIRHLSHVRGRDSRQLIFIHRVIQQSPFDLEGDVVMKLGAKHHSGGEARLHRNFATNSKIRIVDGCDKAEANPRSHIKRGERARFSISSRRRGKGCGCVASLTGFCSGQGTIDQLRIWIGQKGGRLGKGMGIRRIIRPNGVRGENSERQEYTPSAHGGRLGSPTQVSTAYQTAKKERVNSLRNDTGGNSVSGLRWPKNMEWIRF